MFNKVIIIGRLTRDPELKMITSGATLCNFSLALSRNYKSVKGDSITDFIDFIAWQKNAEFLTKYFTKGSQVGIEGNIQMNEYTNKEGIKRRKAEISVEHIFFVGDKKQSQDINIDHEASEMAESKEYDGDLPW